MNKNNPKTKKIKLNPKQIQFCKEYICDYNATQAGIRAGYSKKTAYSQAFELLKKPEIQEEIQKQTRKREEIIKKENPELDGLEVVRRLWAIANLDISSVLTIDEGGGVQAVPINQLPPGTGRLISKIKGKRIIVESADRSKQSAYGMLEYELPDKIKALEMLGKHYGIYEKDNTQKTDSLTELIKVIDARRSREKE